MRHNNPDSQSEYYSDRLDVVSFVDACGRFKFALDIGCGEGRLGKILIENGLVEECDGIEPHKESALEAENHLSQVWNGTSELVAEDVPWERYELVILADVLEHVVDPWAFLKDLHTRCADEVILVLSVPNIRNKSVLGPLVFQGHFEYQDAGIMDRTHLHFFTRSSLNKILADTGWSVQTMDPNIKKKYLKWWFPHRLLGDFMAIQYLIMSQKKPR